MFAIPTLSNVTFHPDARLYSFNSQESTSPSVSSARLTSSQSRELARVLVYLDVLEEALKSSGKNSTESLIESVNVSASVQSSVLATNADDAIGQTQLESTNLVVNASFEDDVINRDFENVRNVTGWSNSADNRIEIWRSVSNMPAIHKDQHVELDVSAQRNDTLDQSVATVAGQVYEFAFAYAPRLRVDTDSNTFEVYFNGELLDTIGESGVDQSALDWRMHSFTVEATSEESEISFREINSDGLGILLDAVSLTESTKPVGTTSVSDISTTADQVALSDAAIESGSIAINNKSIRIDVDNDSLQDIVDSINAAATGVTATLVSAGVNSENQDLFTIDLTSDNGGFLLEDNGTGIIAAIGLQEGAYGKVYETVNNPGSKIRGYRAANALEAIQKSLKTLFRDVSTSGSSSLKSLLSTTFSDMTERYGTSKISALGLDFVEFEDGFLDISRQTRKRFSKAVYEDDKLLEKMFLKTYDTNKNGLIDAIREIVKTELKNNSGAIGSVINTYS